MHSGEKADSQKFLGTMASLERRRDRCILRGALTVLMTCAASLFSILLVFNLLLSGWRYCAFLSFLVFWSGIAAVFVLLGIYAARDSLRGEELAAEIGDITGKGTLFISALEFSAARDRHARYSPFLISETVRRGLAGLDRGRPAGLFLDKGRPGWLAAGILVLLILAVQAGLSGGGAVRLAEALSDPGKSFRPPRAFNLLPLSGDVRAMAGGDVTVELLKTGSREGEIVIRHSVAPGIWKKEDLAPSGETLYGDGPGIYRHRFEGLEDDIEYYFEAGREKTRHYRVKVIHRPVINRLSARLFFPGYTEADPETTGTLAGRIVALSGTRVELEGETSKEISSGAIVMRGGGVIPVEPVAGGFAGRFIVTGDDTMTVEVTDFDGLSNESPVSYPVSALDDGIPVIEIISPEDGAVLPRSLETSIVYRCFDDYGLSSIDLRFVKEAAGGPFRSVPVLAGRGGGVRAVEEAYRWPMESMNLYPGDRILYFLEARDNNTTDGPGYARTETRSLIVPSLSQLYAEARKQEEIQANEMEDILEQGREIKDRLGAISQDFRAEGEMDWSKRSEAGEIADKQRKLREKIAEAADRLDETLEKLESNRMTSLEIGEKMEEIRDLMREIENDDLRRAMEKFRKMMNEVNDGEINKALEDIEMEMDDIVSRLDRTIELLKQVLREEKMEELVRTMEEMIDAQRDIRDSTTTAETEDLSSRQEELRDEYEDFSKSMEEFSKEEAGKAGREFDRLNERMDSSSVDSLMGDSASRLMEGDREGAGCSQGGAIDRMLGLYIEMGRCQMAMSAAVDSELLRIAERAARELVEASKLQEEIPRKIRREAGDGRFNAAIEDQFVVKEAVRQITKDLFEAARRSLNLSGAVFVHLGTALQMMEATMEAMENRRFSLSLDPAGKIHGELNQAVIELMKSTASQGGGSGAEQKMKMMLGRQMSIDTQLKSLFQQKGREGLSMETRAEMARLAAEQRRMKELMSQIAEESRETGEMLGRLDDISSQMEDVARRMEETGPDSELIEREERILSRMLESQRSLNRKDYKRERVSRTAGDIRADRMGMLTRRDERTRNLLEMIRRAMQEKGPSEYREMIAEYFRALSVRIRDEGGEEGR